jgi:hypothetical protein
MPVDLARAPGGGLCSGSAWDVADWLHCRWACGRLAILGAKRPPPQCPAGLLLQGCCCRIVAAAGWTPPPWTCLLAGVLFLRRGSNAVWRATVSSPLAQAYDVVAWALSCLQVVALVGHQAAGASGILLACLRWGRGGGGSEGRKCRSVRLWRVVCLSRQPPPHVLYHTYTQMP